MATSLGNVSDGLSYNAFGEPTSYQVESNGSTPYSAQYERDKLGRITSKTETIGGVATTYRYAYDTAGRLTDVQHDGTTVEHYEYDDNGNRVQATVDSNTVSGTYDDQDRLLTYGNTSYTYTANGELTGKSNGGQTTTYDYDVMDNLMSVGLPDGQQIGYLVDGQNRRVGKQINGSLVQGWLYVDNLNPIAELDGSGNVVSRFVYASRSNIPDYMMRDGATYRIVADHLGSPRLVVNVATGEVVQRMDYDTFGHVIQDTNPGLQPFGFAGGLYDANTGLVRFGARDYDPETGRWTAKDPIGFAGGDANLYGYVGGDAVNWTDWEGLYTGQYPPEPPGYNPKTWKWGIEEQKNGTTKPYLEDPEGKRYYPHREDKGHWQHWDFNQSGRKKRYPHNCCKPWPNQKSLKQHQCKYDPSGNQPELKPSQSKPPRPQMPLILRVTSFWGIFLGSLFQAQEAY